MNLAEFKYRNILSDDGGPIEYISYTKHAKYYGHNFFAKLKSELLPNPKFIPEDSKLKLYKDGGGQGTSFKNKSTAYYKAISEALEYWALSSIKHEHSDQLKSLYGFMIDPTSNGMACFPGLFARSTRKYALKEAIERWSLIAWWDGHIAAKKIDDSSSELLTPWGNYKTIILKSTSLIHHKPIFAFATESNLTNAIFHAQIELQRNSRVVDLYYTNNPQSLSSLMEKRLIYFSTEKGEHDFMDKLNISFKLKNYVTTPPPLIIDSHIPGPWDKYASIWRCLFLPTSNSFFDPTKEKYFYF